MSGAAGQAVRAGIREGSGSGINVNSSAGASSTRALTVPTLAPSPDDVVKLLQGQRIRKKGEKYAAFKTIHQNKGAILEHMMDNAIDPSFFEAIPLGTL